MAYVEASVDRSLYLFDIFYIFHLAAGSFDVKLSATAKEEAFTFQ